MKKIRVGYTNQGNVLAISRPTAIAELLEPNESIVQNWYYNQPQELESFLKQNPNQENYLVKAFAYWVENKLKGCKEIPQRYGTLKRELQRFSKHLFKTLRLIAGRIARDIDKFLKSQPEKDPKTN